MKEKKFKLRDWMIILLLPSAFANGGQKVISTSDNANQKPYRENHQAICYRIAGHEVKCGDFQILNILIKRDHHAASIGSDTLASFSTKTHPGDYPFLTKLANELGYLGQGANSHLENPIWAWKRFDEQLQSQLVNLLSKKPTETNPHFSFPIYFRQCLSYWSNPEAKFAGHLRPINIGEVAALCVADSGILPKTDKKS